MKNCFKDTKLARRRTASRTRCSRSATAGRTRSCSTTRSCSAIAAAGPGRSKLTDDCSCSIPYGIGIKQGNTALKRWVDSRLELMRKRDEFVPILRNNVPPRLVAGFLEEHPAAEATRSRYDAGRRHDACARSGHERRRRGAAARRGRSRSSHEPLLASSLRLVVRLGQPATSCSTGFDGHAQGLGDRDRRRVRDRARARRGARAPDPGRQPARGGLRRGDPQHADPRPDLLPLLRAAAGRDPPRRRSRSPGSR